MYVGWMSLLVGIVWMQRVVLCGTVWAANSYRQPKALITHNHGKPLHLKPTSSFRVPPVSLEFGFE